MWHEHAQFEDKGVSVEAGVMQMLERMQTGRLKVMEHHADWFSEFRLYQRKHGRIVKEHDDLGAPVLGSDPDARGSVLLS
jgi:hypothetical protein